MALYSRLYMYELDVGAIGFYTLAADSHVFAQGIKRLCAYYNVMV